MNRVRVSVLPHMDRFKFPLGHLSFFAAITEIRRSMKAITAEQLILPGTV